MKYTAKTPVAAPEFFVPPGEYKLRVIDAIEKVSKSKNCMIEVKHQVILHDGTEGPKLFDYLVFEDSCFWKIDQFLKSAGMHPGDGADVDVQAQEIIGWEVVATLKVEEYNGSKNNKVVSYSIEEF